MNEQEIFGLMALAKKNQETLETLLASAHRERDELRAQNEALRESIANIGRNARTLNESAAAGAREAVERSMLGVADRASETSRKAAEPLIKRMGEATEAAFKASDDLHAGANAIGGRMVLYAAMAAVGLMVSAAAIGYSIGAWTESEVVELRQERAALQVSMAEFERRAGRAQLSNCDKRLCVRIVPDKTNYGVPGKEVYAVIYGY